MIYARSGLFFLVSSSPSKVCFKNLNNRGKRVLVGSPCWYFQNGFGALRDTPRLHRFRTIQDCSATGGRSGRGGGRDVLGGQPDCDRDVFQSIVLSFKQ